MAKVEINYGMQTEAISRLAEELSRLPETVKAITNPAEYPVIFQ